MQDCEPVTPARLVNCGWSNCGLRTRLDLASSACSILVLICSDTTPNVSMPTHMSPPANLSNQAGSCQLHVQRLNSNNERYMRSVWLYPKRLVTAEAMKSEESARRALRRVLGKGPFWSCAGSWPIVSEALSFGCSCSASETARSLRSLRPAAHLRDSPPACLMHISGTKGGPWRDRLLAYFTACRKVWPITVATLTTQAVLPAAGAERSSADTSGGKTGKVGG